MIFAGWTLVQMAALFGAAGLAITGLYLLRMRRRELEVPFAALWLHVARESESRRLWRKLRRVMSWLVQLLVLALVCFALGDPQPRAWLDEPETVAVVIDLSPSMAAVAKLEPSTEGETTDTRETADGSTVASDSRLHAALVRARAELAALGPSDRGMVIAAGSRPTVPIPLGHQASTQALDELTPSASDGDLAAAMALARHATAGQPAARVVVISDLALSTRDARALGECRQTEACRVVDVGGEAPNLALTSFAARRYTFDRTRVELLAEVQNFASTPAEATLVVRSNDVDVATRPIALGPNGSTTEVFTDLDVAFDRLSAELLPVAGQEAALGIALDDRAFAVVPPTRPVNVTLVSDGTDLFLEAALLSLEEHVRLTALPVERGSADEPAVREADVVIYDVGDQALPRELPNTALIVFDPHRRPDSPVAIEATHAIERPRITEVERDHPVLANVVLKDVNMHRATAFRTEPGDVPLLRHLGEPIAVLREGEQRILAVGFDPRASDWPLRVAFPLFIANSIDYFHRRTPGFVASVRTGPSQSVDVVELGLDLGTHDGPDHVDVETPSGEHLDVPVDDGRLRLQADQTGIYTLRRVGGDTAGVLAVNLADSSASDLRPTLTADDLGPTLSAEAPSPVPVRDDPLWMLAALAAMAVLLAEWATYHQRRTV